MEEMQEMDMDFTLVKMYHLVVLFMMDGLQKVPALVSLIVNGLHPVMQGLMEVEHPMGMDFIIVS